MAIREAILDNIVSTLEGITTDAGYNNTIKLVTREPHNWSNLKPDEKPCAQVLWTRDEKDDETTIGQYILSFLTVNIRGNVYSKTDLETALNAFCEDIEKVICVDQTRGGNAEYSVPKLITPFSGEDSYNIFFNS